MKLLVITFLVGSIMYFAGFANVKKDLVVAGSKISQHYEMIDEK
jgi:hypothetical protein